MANYGKTMKGNDVPMATIQITDSVGVAIPLTSVNDYKINIYRLFENGSKEKIYVLRKTPAAGNGQVIVVDAPTGKVGFIIPRSITIKTAIGLLLAEIEVQLNVGAEYESSLMKVGGDGFIVTEIVESSNPVSII